MSEVEKTWKDIIVGFFRRKFEAEEEKYLKDELKSVGELYKEVNFFNDEQIEYLFDTKRNKKEKDETPLDFQRKRAVAVLTLSDKPETLNTYRKKKNYLKKFKELSRKYHPQTWLSTSSEHAGSVSFATHVIKLTHSKIDTPSIFDSIDIQSKSYLTTSVLKNKAIDGAVAGNQFAPIFQFLELELGGIKLAEQLSKNNRILEGFVQDDEEGEELLEKWIQGFRKSLDKGTPSTHILAKQVYFPLKDNGSLKLGKQQEYHLLCNVVSSSLAHAIYERVFDGRQKPVRKMAEKSKFSQDVYVRFLQRSHLNVTASNHSNASQLNGKRGGKLHLFSTQPPTWQSQLKPPINRQSLFSDLYNATIKTEVDYLRDFLLRFNRLDLSIKYPKRKRHLDRWVNNIIDEFLFYVATIQNLPSGWSQAGGIKLKEAHRYLLDPYRSDEAFQTARQNTDWQAIIRADFARWLNGQLRGKDKQFTAKQEHSRLWRKLLEQPLREHMESIELEIKQQAREYV